MAVPRPFAPVPSRVGWNINGKFLSQSVTGVQRTGRELLAALDRLLARSKEAAPWRLLVPAAAEVPELSAIEVVRVPGSRNLHAWEQLALGPAVGQGRLVSFCGSAPAFLKRQVDLVHDAAVFDCPDAYSAPFVAWYRWLFRRLARQGMGLLTVSEFSRRRLAEVLELDPQRIGVVGNGADHFQRIHADFSLNAAHGLDAVAYLLVVGSRQRTKNQAAVIEAWRRLQGGDARLVVVGRSNRRVFRTARDPDAAGVIHLAEVDDASLKGLLLRARGLVFPSLYEGFGLPPVEAMSCGCPVIASDAAAIPEVCGDAALYVKPNDVQALAVSMGRLLRDDALRVELSARGRRRAAMWRWDDCAVRLLAGLDAASARCGS
jgi:glycosyltransferase involved in cell wall biosynthesis